MGLDRDLVRDAEAARRRLIESQHAAEQARADFHRAVRRLHAAGASMREIADALRLRHERVFQIVDEAAEPEPRWRRRRRPARRWRWQAPPGSCGFCGRSREECAKLIAGPGLFICDRCVVRASRPEGGSAAEVGAEAPLPTEPPGSGARCGFCGKDGAQVRRLVAGGVASAPGGKVGTSPRICDECLALCEEILAETAPS